MKARTGYTLLEVMLAIGIGLLLVAALYIALDVQFRYMQAGRGAVAEGQLARGLFNRLAADIRVSLATLPEINQAAIDDASAGANPLGSVLGALTGQGASSGSSEDATGDGKVNYGIVGDEFQMTLFLSTVPRYGRGETNLAAAASDLRQVTYYLIPNEGLARQEVRLVTAEDLSAEAPPDILAEEVVDLHFQYYDAATMTWVPTWDGTTNGPPLAVEIVLGVLPPRETAQFSTAPKPPTYYRMVVAIPSANFPLDSTASQSGGSP